MIGRGLIGLLGWVFLAGEAWYGGWQAGHGNRLLEPQWLGPLLFVSQTGAIVLTFAVQSKLEDISRWAWQLVLFSMWAVIGLFLWHWWKTTGSDIPVIAGIGLTVVLFGLLLWTLWLQVDPDDTRDSRIFFDSY